VQPQFGQVSKITTHHLASYMPRTRTLLNFMYLYMLSPQSGSMSPQSLGGPAASGGAPPAGGAASSAGGGAAPPRQQRQRARRGQATDPHSIAERVCHLFLSCLKAELFPFNKNQQAPYQAHVRTSQHIAKLQPQHSLGLNSTTLEIKAPTYQLYLFQQNSSVFLS